LDPAADLVPRPRRRPAHTLKRSSSHASSGVSLAKGGEQFSKLYLNTTGCRPYVTLMSRPYTHRMLKSFRTTILTIGSVLRAISGAGPPQPPPPDTGKPAPTHHAKTRKSSKKSSKK